MDDPFEGRKIWRYESLYVGQRAILKKEKGDRLDSWRNEHIKEHNLLAFMTPDGTNAAAGTRKESVRAWCEDHWQTRGQPGRYQTLKNEPLPEFKIVGFETRSTTSNRLIRIEDPRDFVIEIPVSNLVELIQDCVIVDGVIQGECVWGREGSNHLLMPKDSPLWKHARDKK